MLRFKLLILVACLYACNQHSKTQSKTQHDNAIQSSGKGSYKPYMFITARFNAFDTTVEVLIVNTQSIGVNQRKNYDGFLEKQNVLTPEILKTIFELYQRSYLDYKKGWTMSGSFNDKELEKYLPTPTTPEHLKRFLTPAIVYIPREQDCEEGSIGIKFDCTWDRAHGIDVVIKKWRVTEASIGKTYM